MKHSLAILLAALALTGCGEEKKSGGTICRLDSGQAINAADKTECEDYYDGEWGG